MWSDIPRVAIREELLDLTVEVDMRGAGRER
jgi:hypothetical protein